MTPFSLFKYLLQSGDVAIDAGAHIGSSTLPMADAVGPLEKVFAFAPQGFNFSRLCSNVALNGLTNVYPQCAALIANNQPRLAMPFVDYRGKVQSGYIQMYRHTKNIKEEQIITTTLNDHINLVRNATLLKIDVERYELEVLLGAKDLLKLNNLKFIYFESHNRNKFNEIIALLKTKNQYFEFYWHPSPIFDNPSFRGKSEDIYGGLGYSLNILAASEPFAPFPDLFYIKNHIKFLPENDFPEKIARKI